MVFIRKYLWLFIFLLSTLGGMYFFSNVKREIDPEKVAASFQRVFLDRESQARSTLISLKETFEKRGVQMFSDAAMVQELHSLYDRNSRVVVLTLNDSIRFISHNTLPIHHQDIPAPDNKVHRFANGWYHVYTTDIDGFTLWVLSLIKKEYRYKNRFLRNVFQHEFSTPYFFEISTNESDEGYTIYDSTGNLVFLLTVPDDQSLDSKWVSAWLISLMLSIVSIVSLLYFVYTIFCKLHNRGYWFLSKMGLFMSLLFLRWILFHFQWPLIWYDGVLFSADHYAAHHLIPSLGDLLLNLIFIIIMLFFIAFRQGRSKSDSNVVWLWKELFYSLLIIVSVTFSSLAVVAAVRSLVINSNLNLNVKFIFDPDLYHVVGFFIITAVFLSYYMLSVIFLSFHRRIAKTRGKLLIIHCGLIVLIPILIYVISIEDYWLWLVVFLSSWLVVFQKPLWHKDFSFSRMLFTFFVFALITTYALIAYNKEKELALRHNVALRIASEQDPVAEFLFSQIETELFNDRELKQIILNNPLDEEFVLDYLRAEYIGDFWSRYDIQVTICMPGEVLLFKPFDEHLVCDEFFTFYIDEFGRPTLSNNLFYLDNNTGRNSYIARMPVKNPETGKVDFNVYIEFESRFIPRELGFPELLVDERINITRNLGDYSYAIYKRDIMTHKFGSYFFSLNVNSYGVDSDEIFVVFESDGYSHLLFRRDSETKIMVSKPKHTVLENIAPFSYLFLFFLFTAIGLWVVLHIATSGFTFSVNFKKRLQFTIIGIVLVSVAAIGSASAWFIFNIYKNKNESFINEKAHSILIEMENNLGQVIVLDEGFEDYLSQLLLSLSNVFFTDINIFDLQGNLLASSRPKVFTEGLVGPFIDPIAFNRLKISGKSLFIHNERIGNLEYISAYVPLRNFMGEIIAYINLPYFAQQSELRNEISFFLVAFINIYLLLLLLSVVIAFFISNHVTRPLQIIRDSISRLSIGRTNKKIEWSRNDEIGQLISEYNRMIDELSISAELLARSERESAWREMAKQVAHEIKNPLTPMRLNVQYLQKAWKDKAEDWENRLERFTNTMVEQIDNLSIIASEFSDFAKMPAAKNEVIDLNKFIPTLPDLYKGFDKADISCILDGTPENLTIFADRKQLLRVFNNLIKNAIQAYTRDSVARVIIKCAVDSNYARIEIRDFGGGIAEDFKKNIFQPYFTTKTSGMGLGLAMVKSIIQSFNGHISFESELGIGTVFIIRFPIYQQFATDPTTQDGQNRFFIDPDVA